MSIADKLSRVLMAPIRIFGIFIIVFSFIGHMALVYLFVREKWARVRRSNKVLRFYCKAALRNFNVRVLVFGLDNLQSVQGALLVGNHTGYLDVLAISSNVQTCFVTSTEIKNAPLLGQICSYAGCLFVDRKNRSNIHNELSELRNAQVEGINVAIFPEATSTNGEKILKFKRPFFISAIDAGKSIVPVCLNYRTVGGQPINGKNRDNVFWYGDMGFVESLIGLSSCGGAEVELHFLSAISTSANSDARLLAEVSQAAIEAVYQPVPASF